MSVKRLDLGAVSAYALAVEQGYQGTEEEFGMILANAANYASDSKDAKEAAENAAGEASESARLAGIKLEEVNTAASNRIKEIEDKAQEQKEAVKNEIEAKGKETLESIPEDYTELQRGVSNLKDDLDNSLGYNYYKIEPIWTNGAFYNRFAALISDTHASYTEIEVKASEKYHIIGYNAYLLSLYSLRDSNKNNVTTYPDASDKNYEKRKFDEYITIPEGVKYLCVSKWDSFGEMLVEKESYTRVSDIDTRVTELEDGTIDFFEYENIKKRVIENQMKNDFAWSDFDGLYATITFDDTNADIDQLQDLAEELGIPFCYATIPSKLGNIMSQGTETAKQVLERAVANGGEVLSHWGSPLNSLSTDEDYYNVYVGAKKALMENGFEVNGIITAGGGAEGTPQSYKTQDWEKVQEICRIYYKYADLVSNDYNGIDTRHIEQFYNPRKFTDGGIESMKLYIDTMVSNSTGWLNMASHGTNHPNTPNIDAFREIFQYAINNGFTFVTWGEMYDKFKSSKLEERIKTLELN